MAARRRIRTVKPELYEDEKVGMLSIEERYFFIGLFSLADDSGRVRWISRSILGDLFPYDDHLTARKIEKWTKNLEKFGLIVRYKVNDRTYCEIKNWNKHQTISKPKPSILPSLSETDVDLSGTEAGKVPKQVSGRSPDSRENMEGKGREGKGKEPPNPLQGGDVRPDVEQLCELLHDLIVENGSKPPTAQKRAGWAVEARRLLDLDRRPLDEALGLVRWCQAHSFWKSNISSMGKFRKQYDTLRLQRQGQIEKKPGKIAPLAGNIDGDKLKARDARRVAEATANLQPDVGLEKIFGGAA